METAMRFTIGILFAALLTTTVLAQEKKVPKDSMRVTIPGCTKGRVFTAGPRTEDQVGRADVPEGMHLRMNGPKKVMSDLKAHEGQMIQITGLMKKGQPNDFGIPVGGGVRVAPGVGNGGISVGGGRALSTVGSINYIDVDSWGRARRAARAERPREARQCGLRGGASPPGVGVGQNKIHRRRELGTGGR